MVTRTFSVAATDGQKILVSGRCVAHATAILSHSSLQQIFVCDDRIAYLLDIATLPFYNG